MRKAKNISIIKESEGLRLYAYRCPAGILTIGWGHTKGVYLGMKITKSQAEDFLRSDLSVAEDIINRYCPKTLQQHQFDALVSFVFNVGAKNFTRSTLFKRVRYHSGDLKIYQEFVRWINANGKPLRGLLLRRIKEANLYFNIK